MFKYFVIISFCIIVSKSVLEMGEFDLKVTSYEACKAPRRKYCADVKTNVFDDVWVKFDILIKENMTTIKCIYMGSLNNKEIIRLRVKDMCEHIFFKPVLLATYSSNGRCGLFKGRHVFSADMQAMFRNIYGGKFMYGNWTFRSLYFNDYCSLHCGIFKLLVTPKKMSKSLL